jgi:hypothetical protein
VRRSRQSVNLPVHHIASRYVFHMIEEHVAAVHHIVQENARSSLLWRHFELHFAFNEEKRLATTKAIIEIDHK